MSRWSGSAFGLNLESSFPLWEETRRHCALPYPTVKVLGPGEPRAAAALLSGAPVPVWKTTIDDRAYTMERGAAGDHRFVWGEDAVFHLSAGADVLTCGLAEPEDAGARRVLCDTVLFSISLLRGYVLLHAGSVCLGETTVAIAGASGAGKTSLVAELLGRDACLLSDDILALSRAGGHVVAHASPPVMNLPLRTFRASAPAIGYPVAVLGDEVWVNVAVRAPEPRRLTAICLLERAAGLPTRVERHPRAPLAILPHALGFPSSRERLSHRFGLLSELVAEVPVLRLTAGEDGTPDVLADVIEGELTAVALGADSAVSRS